MGRIYIYYRANKLLWTALPTDDTNAFTNCDEAFSALERGRDIHLVCSARQLVSHRHVRYKMVRAAGGVVTNQEGQRLIIQREGMWDLPKGMVETGETLAYAALREVREETGVTATLMNRKPLLKTYHIYDKYGGWHLKQTSWFAMTADYPTPLLPQQEEGIEEVAWVDPVEWRDRLYGSFASLRAVAESGMIET